MFGGRCSTDHTVKGCNKGGSLEVQGGFRLPAGGRKAPQAEGHGGGMLLKSHGAGSFAGLRVAGCGELG